MATEQGQKKRSQLAMKAAREARGLSLRAAAREISNHLQTEGVQVGEKKTFSIYPAELRRWEGRDDGRPQAVAPAGVLNAAAAVYGSEVDTLAGRWKDSKSPGSRPLGAAFTEALVPPESVEEAAAERLQATLWEVYGADLSEDAAAVRTVSRLEAFYWTYRKRSSDLTADDWATYVATVARPPKPFHHPRELPASMRTAFWSLIEAALNLLSPHQEQTDAEET